MARGQIYRDTRGQGTCRGCGKAIQWAQMVQTGHKMPFDTITVLLVTEDPTTHRAIEIVDLSTNHWATCPSRDQFTHKGSNA